MSDFIFLLRLSFFRWKRIVWGAAAYFLLVHVCIVCYALVANPREHEPGATVAALSSIGALPLMAIAFALFGFNDLADLNQRGSGYLPWLLRSPVKSWKLATAPVVLMTAWILAVCGGFAVACRLAGYANVRWFLPGLGLAALAVLGKWMVWYPFQWRHTRLLISCLAVVPFYVWFAGCLMVAFGAETALFRTLSINGVLGEMLVWMVGTVSYAAVVWAAVHSVSLARRNVAGQIRESAAGEWGIVRRFKRHLANPNGKDTSRMADRGDALSPLPRVSGARTSGAGAVLFYDAAKLSRPASLAIIAVWVLIVTLWCLVTPSDGGVIPFACATLFFPALFLAEWVFAANDRSFLPGVLAMAPIRSSTIVWCRQASVTLAWLISVSGILLVMAAWGLRGILSEWISNANEQLSQVLGAPEKALPVATIVYLLLVLLVVRHATWAVAIESTGKRRYRLYSTLAKFFIASVVIGWFLHRFIQLPAWGAGQQFFMETVGGLAEWMPWLVGLRIALVCVASWMLVRSGAAGRRECVMLFAGYLLAVCSLFLITTALMSGTPVRWWHCGAAVLILVPYSRIALAPLCLASLRHR